MKVTPSMTAMAVSARRSLWGSRPLRVTRPMSAAEDPHALEGRVRGRLTYLVDHPAVGEEHDAVGEGRAVRVVGDHDDRLAHIGHRTLQERQQLRRRVRVEVAGRLVGEDEGRPVDERPCTGHSLLLPPGHLARTVAEALSEAELADQVVEPRLIELAARQVNGQRAVLRAPQRWHQVEGLEDE